MRHLLVTSVLVGLVASPAWADRRDPNITGAYDVKYEEVANNCTTATPGSRSSAER